MRISCHHFMSASFIFIHALIYYFYFSLFLLSPLIPLPPISLHLLLTRTFTLINILLILNISLRSSMPMALSLFAASCDDEKYELAAKTLCLLAWNVDSRVHLQTQEFAEVYIYLIISNLIRYFWPPFLSTYTLLCLGRTLHLRASSSLIFLTSFLQYYNYFYLTSCSASDTFICHIYYFALSNCLTD